MNQTIFKVGDKVSLKHGLKFFSGLYVHTICRIDGNPGGPDVIVWMQESDSWHYARNLELAEESKALIEGVSPDQPVVYNEKGGGQSKSPYRMDLVDPKSILEIASVLKHGADKYGDDNWKLISTQDHLNHLLVHVYAHLAGDESDKHLAHAACRAIFALGVELEGE